LVNYNAENKYQLFDVTHQQYIDEVSNFSGDTLELNTGDIVENTSYEIHIRNDNWPYFEVLDAEIKKFAVLPAPEITQDGFILTSSIGAQYTWYFNNEKIASQDREIIIEGMGTYQVGVTNT
jgi:hypothetical protein